MAQPAERQLNYSEREQKIKEIDQVLSDLSPGDTNQVRSVVLSKYSRRDFLVRSGQLGLAAGAAVAVAGLAAGFRLGEGTGAQGERDRLFPKGDLTPELSNKLDTAGYFAPEIPEGLTIAKMRGAGLD